MGFTEQIGQLTGSATANDGTTIAQALENAQLDVIQKVAQIQPDMLHTLSSEVTSTSNGDSDNDLVNNIVLNVNRADGTSGYLDTSPTSTSYAEVDNNSVGGDPYAPTSASGGTFACWIKFLNSDKTPIFSSNDGTANNVSNNAGWRLLKDASDKLYFQWGLNTGSYVDDNPAYYRRVTAQNILSPEIWYHIAIKTSFGTTGNTVIFINGQKASIEESGTATFSGVSPEYNGSYSSAFIGYHIKLNPGSPTETYGDLHLKNFAVYGKALDDLEIESLYNNGSHFNWLNPLNDYISNTSLKAYWDFTMASLEDLIGNVGETVSLENSAVLTNYRYNASYIDRKYVNKVQDFGSIYYADATSPVYTINNGSVQIYPIPTATESALITKVVPGAINDGAETIASMPRFLHTQVVKLAAFYVFLQRIGGVRDSLPTDLNDTTVFDAIADFNDSIGVTTALPSVPGAYSNAIDKAQALIDDVAGIGGDTNTDGSDVDIYSAQKWLVDEDPEMLQSTLAVASQELQRASTALSSHSAEINKYQAEISKESAEAGQALQEYQANLTKKIQSFTTLIGKLTTDYQWMTAQLGVIKNMIDEGWASIFTPKSDNDISRVGVRS